MPVKVLGGLFLSYLLLFVCFIFAVFLPKLNVSKEITRKIVHISIANWWIIALWLLDNYYALIPPVTFVGLNYLSYRFRLVKGIERDDKSELGTIFYPVSMILLVLFGLSIGNLYVGALGGLVMGYSDGMATIIGRRCGKRKLFQKKTLAGTLTMFFMTILTTAVLLSIYHPQNLLIYSLVVAVFATLTELFFSEGGFDNVSVPVVTSLIYYLLLLIS